MRFEQGQDLLLYRHIKRRGRFVTDQQNRIERQRARDRQPLALSARERMRIPLEHIRVQTNPTQHFGGLVAPRLLGPDLVNFHGLGQRLLHPHARRLSDE